MFWSLTMTRENIAFSWSERQLFTDHVTIYFNDLSIVINFINDIFEPRLKKKSVISLTSMSACFCVCQCCIFHLKASFLAEVKLWALWKETADNVLVYCYYHTFCGSSLCFFFNSIISLTRLTAKPITAKMKNFTWNGEYSMSIDAYLLWLGGMFILNVYPEPGYVHC